MTFGQTVKALRRQADMTQENLAEILSVSPQAVSRWETGVAMPDISLLPPLSELFRVSIDQLLGVNEKERQNEIQAVLTETEQKINQGITREPIQKLRQALEKYPHNEYLLCELMYALYVASENEELCKTYDHEIISIAQKIQHYAIHNDSRNESRRLLFRHYCDTNRTEQAMQIAREMASIETCRERNIYWALEGDDRATYLKERIADDLGYLLWGINAYSYCADLPPEQKEDLNSVCKSIENTVKETLNL